MYKYKMPIIFTSLWDTAADQTTYIPTRFGNNTFDFLFLKIIQQFLLDFIILEL